MLVESAWSYRFPARQTKHLKGKARNASPVAKQIAWKAQTRLGKTGENRDRPRFSVRLRVALFPLLSTN
jgi:hypothetical protein